MVPKTSENKTTDKKGNYWDWRNDSVIESTRFNFQHPHGKFTVHFQGSMAPGTQVMHIYTHICMQAKYPYTEGKKVNL